MHPDKLHKLMREVFHNEILDLRKQGQKEYASDEDAFANFKLEAKECGVDLKIVLWIYAMKHKRGIASFIRGHKSQREGVRGRINDLIVYLFLLRGIIDEEEKELSDAIEDVSKKVGPPDIHGLEESTGSAIPTGDLPSGASAGPTKVNEKDDSATDQKKPIDESNPKSDS